jgi:hypothetical protein
MVCSLVLMYMGMSFDLAEYPRLVSLLFFFGAVFFLGGVFCGLLDPRSFYELTNTASAWLARIACGPATICLFVAGFMLSMAVFFLSAYDPAGRERREVWTPIMVLAILLVITSLPGIYIRLFRQRAP